MSKELQWNYVQCFGDKTGAEEITEADLISTVEFDHSGEYLATGDKGGRVVLFQRSNDQSVKKPAKKGDCFSREYKFFTEFQSHEPEFDYLKSLEIEEKINKIKWLPRRNNAHFLLTTNDKTIKLWKISQQKIKHVSTSAMDSVGAANLRIPQVQASQSVVRSTPRRVFANAHAYHINSISLNSDYETYLSADDLRINLWNLENNEQSFNIVDIKPANMEELIEVITAAEFHPKHCNLFMYSSSKGTIKLGDMRANALCDNHVKLFEKEEDPTCKSFFSEIISSISDVKFSNDGRYILSRDYLTLKIWDINMESRPVQTINIHEHLRSKLCDLYENDCIFDKFECTFSGDASYCMTGSYHNYFHIYSFDGREEAKIEASKTLPQKKRPQSSVKKLGLGRGKKESKKDDINVDALDFTKKNLHSAWHPKEHTLAIAAANNLYIYNAS